jgi:hypothetical protein
MHQKPAARRFVCQLINHQKTVSLLLDLKSEKQQFSDASEYALDPRIPRAKALVGIRGKSIEGHLSERPVFRPRGLDVNTGRLFAKVDCRREMRAMAVPDAAGLSRY